MKQINIFGIYICVRSFEFENCYFDLGSVSPVIQAPIDHLMEDKDSQLKLFPETAWNCVCQCSLWTKHIRNLVKVSVLSLWFLL